MTKTRLARIKRLLTHRRMPLIVTGLAVALTLPSLWGGLVIDDYFSRLVIRRPAGYPVELPHVLDTFTFISGDPVWTGKWMDFGAMPWWMNPEARGSFWRPLTALTQNLDHRAWPEQVWLMHLQSVAWYAALVLLVAALYRRFLGVTLAAGLAALMFAVDEAHATPVGFLSNRNSLIACVFGMLALLAHDRWRRDRKGRMGAAAAGSFAASLFAAEAGIATAGYLAAYALFLDRGGWKRRLVSLVPYAVLSVVWRAAWVATGHGIAGMGLYADPGRQPLDFLWRVVTGAPVLVTGQLAGPAPEFQIVSLTIQPMTWWIFAGMAVAFVWGLCRVLPMNRTVGFFGTGAVLCVLPACATIPQSRMLLFVGIGASAILSLAMTRAVWRGWRRAAGFALILIHFVMAPVALAFFSRFPVGPAGEIQREVTIPEIEGIENRDLIILNHPIPFQMFHYLGDRAIEGSPYPARSRVLAHAFSPLLVERTDSRSLRVRCEAGFPDFFSSMLGGIHRRVGAGDEISLAGMKVRIEDAGDDGVPLEAYFIFDRDLEDDSFVWLKWSKRRFRRFAPPAIGQTVRYGPARVPFGLPPGEIERRLRRGYRVFGGI